jgi:glycosyltransferase involved in cell wall biosynthesis
MREGFPKRFRKRMRTIPNPVRIIASKRDRSRGTGPKTILSVGRLEKQKDQATLIEAFARLASDFPNWNLRIIGEGSLRQDLEAQIAGLHGRAELPGAVADIEREFAAADLFAMPSLYESFGIATAEALAAGLPAVGFADCPGTNELIDDGTNGLLVRGADRADAIADGLARLMRDEDLRARLGAAGPASVEKYSLASVADRWEQLLSDVASGKEVGR